MPVNVYPAQDGRAASIFIACDKREDIWLPMVDALRNQFAGPSKEMMDTILVAQNQVKDGFLQSTHQVFRST